MADDVDAEEGLVHALAHVEDLRGARGWRLGGGGPGVEAREGGPRLCVLEAKLCVLERLQCRGSMDGRPQCCLVQVLARRVRGCNARHAGLERVPQVWVALDALRVLDGGCGIDGTEDDAGHKGEEEGERRLAIPVAAARLRVVPPEQQQVDGRAEA